MPFRKTTLLITIFSSLTLHAFSQNEMEKDCIKIIKEYSATINFPKFSGVPIVFKDTIKFDSSCIVIWNTAPELIKIFESGTVFPDLILGASTRGYKYAFKKTFRADTLIISDLSELNFPNQKPGSKWFSFLLHQRITNPMILNPSLYLFELTNEKANSQSPVTEFIQKAKVTAFGFCSVLF